MIFGFMIELLLPMRSSVFTMETFKLKKYLEVKTPRLQFSGVMKMPGKPLM